MKNYAVNTFENKNNVIRYEKIIADYYLQDRNFEPNIYFKIDTNNLLTTNDAFSSLLAQDLDYLVSDNDVYQLQAAGVAPEEQLPAIMSFLIDQYWQHVTTDSKSLFAQNLTAYGLLDTLDAAPLKKPNMLDASLLSTFSEQSNFSKNLPTQTEKQTLMINYTQARHILQQSVDQNSLPATTRQTISDLLSTYIPETSSVINQLPSREQLTPDNLLTDTDTEITHYPKLLLRLINKVISLSKIIEISDSDTVAFKLKEVVHSLRLYGSLDNFKHALDPKITTNENKLDTARDTLQSYYEKYGPKDYKNRLIDDITKLNTAAHNDQMSIKRAVEKQFLCAELYILQNDKELLELDKDLTLEEMQHLSTQLEDFWQRNVSKKSIANSYYWNLHSINGKYILIVSDILNLYKQNQVLNQNKETSIDQVSDDLQTAQDNLDSFSKKHSLQRRLSLNSTKQLTQKVNKLDTKLKQLQGRGIISSALTASQAAFDDPDDILCFNTLAIKYPHIAKLYTGNQSHTLIEISEHFKAALMQDISLAKAAALGEIPLTLAQQKQARRNVIEQRLEELEADK